uniref:Mitochondrial inner membrane protease subunit n=1 Tax=Eptatretus burgeri TaxID=7764 RepID=A0A8C4N375_EPTBU
LTFDWLPVAMVAIDYIYIYICICICIYCWGPSMEPTLYTNDMVFAETISRRLFRINRGDVVVVCNPMDPHTQICKRVIGMEGDIVCTNNKFPIGHVWLEGDNMEHSSDSRLYGPVPYALIRSRVVWKVSNFWSSLHEFDELFDVYSK